MKVSAEVLLIYDLFESVGMVKRKFHYFSRQNDAADFYESEISIGVFVFGVNKFSRSREVFFFFFHFTCCVVKK